MALQAHEVLTLLEDCDKQALIRLYQLRCLSVQQLYQLYYCTRYETLRDFIQGSLQRLISLELVQLSVYAEAGYGITLENAGVQVVRQLLNLPPNVFSEQKHLVKRGYLRASDLRVLPRFMNHQIHLNQVVLDFDQQLGNAFPQVNYRYSDEKHLSQYLSIRPDGLLQLLDVDLFLEMDMGTESRAVLAQKWRHYRTFFKGETYAYNERKVVVLMICEGEINLQARRELIMQTAFEVLGDCFSQYFEMYVGSTRELNHLLFQQLIPGWLNQENISTKWQTQLQQNGFKLFRPTRFNQHFKRGHYQLFGQYSASNYPNIEFFIDDWRTFQMSVVTNLAFHHQNNSLLRNVYPHTIKHLIFVENEFLCQQTLTRLNLLTEPGVFFITTSRLKSKPLHQAVFVFDSEGLKYHFQDKNLQIRVLEV